MLQIIPARPWPAALSLAAVMTLPQALGAQHLSKQYVLPGAVCPKPAVPVEAIVPAPPGAPADAAPQMLTPPAELLADLPGKKGAQARLAFDVDVDGRMNPCTITIMHDNDSTWAYAVIQRLATARFTPARFRGTVVPVRMNQLYTKR